MRNQKPIISVIMSVYNGEKYLSEAIESIIDQTFKNFEFIIFDDGSTDNSSKLIVYYANIDSRIIAFENHFNIGNAASLNKGILMAEGEFIAVMDADDICLPSRLENQVNFLQDNPQIGLCGSQAKLLENHEFVGITDKPLTHNEILCQMVFSCSIIHPTVMFRRDLFINNDLLYNPKLKAAKDYDLWERALPLVRFENLPETLLIYRIHKNQVSNKYEKQQIKIASVVHRRFINKLGITYSKKEVNLHKPGIWWKISHTSSTYVELENWLKRLKTANQEKQIYPVPQFNQAIQCYLGTVHNNLVEQSSYGANEDSRYVKKGLIQSVIQLISSRNFLNKFDNLNESFSNLWKSVWAGTGKIKRVLRIPVDIYIIRSSDLYNEEYYINANTDVKKDKIYPLLHFLFYGGFEGRDPSPDFNSNFYLSAYDDVRKANINPLIHYLRFGWKEGRKIKPENAEEN